MGQPGGRRRTRVSTTAGSGRMLCCLSREPSWPMRPSPQVYTWPASVSAAEWNPPQATCMMAWSNSTGVGTCAHTPAFGHTGAHAPRTAPGHTHLGAPVGAPADAAQLAVEPGAERVHQGARRALRCRARRPFPLELAQVLQVLEAVKDQLAALEVQGDAARLGRRRRRHRDGHDRTGGGGGIVVRGRH